MGDSFRGWVISPKEESGRAILHHAPSNVNDFVADSTTRRGTSWNRLRQGDTMASRAERSARRARRLNVDVLLARCRIPAPWRPTRVHL
jgi:hypothetical protein